MADCTSDPAYLLHAAECAISKPLMQRRRDALMRDYGPAYHDEQGRQYDLAMIARTTEPHARKLIWC